ncbi:hypothetical protein BC829DRAFT_382821 [Chytridium lagenaria]|nr:hypothetical protein BC829DRAFT_382821 [Chytridium lagenaria]
MISQHSLLSTQISIAPPIQQQQHVVKPSSQSQDNPETVAMPPSYPNIQQQTAQPCASQKPDTLHNGAVQKNHTEGSLQGSQIMQVDETGTINTVRATDNKHKGFIFKLIFPKINDEGDGEDNTGNGEKVNVVMESTEVLNDGEANGSKGRKRKATKAADVGDGTERGKRGRGRGRRGK